MFAAWPPIDLWPFLEQHSGDGSIDELGSTKRGLCCKKVDRNDRGNFQFAMPKSP